MHHWLNVVNTTIYPLCFVTPMNTQIFSFDLLDSTFG